MPVTYIVLMTSREVPHSEAELMLMGANFELGDAETESSTASGDPRGKAA